MKLLKGFGIHKCIQFYDENEERKLIVNKKEPKMQSCKNTFQGIFLAFLSGTLYCVSSVFVKLDENLYAGDLMIIRMLCLTIFSLPFAIKSQAHFYQSGTLLLLLLTGITMAASTLFRYEAYQRLPLAKANVIVFSSPVLISLLAVFFLKDKMSWALIISLLLSTLGLFVIMKIPLLIIYGDTSSKLKGESETAGLIYAGLTLVVDSVCTVLTARLKQYHFSILIFHTSWTGALAGLGLIAAFGRARVPDPSLFHPVYILAFCACNFLSLMFWTAALYKESAGPVAISVNIPDIVLSFIFQVCLFHDPADIFSVVGAILITASGVFLTFCKWISVRKDTGVSRACSCLRL